MPTNTDIENVEKYGTNTQKIQAQHAAGNLLNRDQTRQKVDFRNQGIKQGLKNIASNLTSRNDYRNALNKSASQIYGHRGVFANSLGSDADALEREKFRQGIRLLKRASRAATDSNGVLLSRKDRNKWFKDQRALLRSNMADAKAKEIIKSAGLDSTGMFNTNVSKADADKATKSLNTLNRNAGIKTQVINSDVDINSIITGQTLIESISKFIDLDEATVVNYCLNASDEELIAISSLLSEEDSSLTESRNTYTDYELEIGKRYNNILEKYGKDNLEFINNLLESPEYAFEILNKNYNNINDRTALKAMNYLDKILAEAEVNVNITPDAEVDVTLNTDKEPEVEEEVVETPAAEVVDTVEETEEEKPEDSEDTEEAEDEPEDDDYEGLSFEDIEARVKNGEFDKEDLDDLLADEVITKEEYDNLCLELADEKVEKAAEEVEDDGGKELDEALIKMFPDATSINEANTPAKEVDKTIDKYVGIKGYLGPVLLGLFGTVLGGVIWAVYRHEKNGSLSTRQLKIKKLVEKDQACREIVAKIMDEFKKDPKHPDKRALKDYREELRQAIADAEDRYQHEKDTLEESTYIKDVLREDDEVPESQEELKKVEDSDSLDALAREVVADDEAPSQECDPAECEKDKDEAKPEEHTEEVEIDREAIAEAFLRKVKRGKRKMSKCINESVNAQRDTKSIEEFIKTLSTATGLNENSTIAGVASLPAGSLLEMVFDFINEADECIEDNGQQEQDLVKPEKIDVPEDKRNLDATEIPEEYKEKTTEVFPDDEHHQETDLEDKPEDKKPEVPEEKEYTTFKEAYMMNKDYFDKDSYIRNTASRKQERLQEQMALMIAKETNDRLFTELTEAAANYRSLEKRIYNKYAVLAEAKKNEFLKSKE